MQGQGFMGNYTQLDFTVNLKVLKKRVLFLKRENIKKN